jgi:hypothetical protein
VSLHGSGFIVTPEQAADLGLGRVPGLERHIRPYRNGRDITQISRDVMVIDLFGLNETEVRDRFPEVYQWILERVKPARDQNRRASYRDNWWIHGEPRASFRPALEGLERYIATVETSKHRFFVFLDAQILPDNKLVNIASDDSYVLGVLSSRIHVEWALAAGGRLVDRPVYVKSKCFEAFPFPAPTEEQMLRIRDLAEKLNAHRKRQQQLYPTLTLTAMYNVLEKLRSEEPLTEAERTIHEYGLVAVLRQLHDELDQAVASAYGWPADLSTPEILMRLVALNRERVAEEAQGRIRWLRPEYQNPAGTVQTQIEGTQRVKGKRRQRKIPWPKALAGQAAAITAVLAQSPEPLDMAQLAASFKGARRDRLQEILETLEALGQIRMIEEEGYTTL